MKQRYEDGEASWLEYRGYQVVYVCLCLTMGSQHSNSASTIWEKSSLSPKNWFAESFATDYLGMDYHSDTLTLILFLSRLRRIRVLRTVHDTTLAGTTEVYGSGNDLMPALAYFTIDSPVFGESELNLKHQVLVPTPD